MTDRDAYTFEIDSEKLKLYKRLSPEERFLWLEETHEFVKNAVSVDKIKKWKQYINGESKPDTPLSPKTFF